MFSSFKNFNKLKIIFFILLCLSPIVFAFIYVFKFGVNVVYCDQWETVVILKNIINGTFKLSDLFFKTTLMII